MTRNRYVYKHIELLLSKVNIVINTDDEVEDYVLRKHKHWLTADFSSGGGKIYALQFQFLNTHSNIHFSYVSKITVPRGQLQ